MKKTIPVIFIAAVALASCKKGPGEGGNSSIKGLVFVQEWNSSFTYHDSTMDHVGMDEDVYIIYGDDATYGDRIKSGPDGVFEFKYLRTGKYSVYVYTKDTVAGGQSAVQKIVEITSKDQTVDAGTFTIKN